jgi:hypothetical protein
MAKGRPTLRQRLAADALLSKLRSGFADIAEHRSGDVNISLRDALRSAFALFSLTAPSLLAFDKERTEGNWPRVYGIERVPCDTAMRELLDPVDPESLRPAFKQVLRQLQRGQVLEELVWVEGHYLLALDGTGYFPSHQIHCESCREKHQRTGTVTYSHQMVGAALIPPDQRDVIALMPEPIIQQDGTNKNEGERNAATRFLTKFRQDHPHLQVMVTADRRSSHAPHIEMWQAHDVHYMLGVKAGEHAF